MSRMGHSLPTADYGQQQYNPGTTSHSAASVSHYTQAQMGGQPFYMTQAPLMPNSPYYGSPMSAMSQQGQVMTQQNGFAYYPGQVQPMAPYQYSQHSQYPSQNKGHAIWIGNLPPQTNLMELVQHVCKHTEDLESLFLISKSNCAFANFKDESSCIEAQQKINDTRFMSVRLVSRLRKNVVDVAQGMIPPTGPASLTAAPQPLVQQQQQNRSHVSTPEAKDGDADEEEDGEEESPAEEAGLDNTWASSTDISATTSVSTTIASSPAAKAEIADGPEVRSKDRFFILKSLTVEDLESSMRTGIWATQSHNEETLNSAFKNCDNVYLIFSANKSGEYFGYARMTSEINNDPAAAIEFAPRAQSFSDEDYPKAIPTEATDFAPPGRIIDDSARGTIFWEAQRDDAPEAATAANGTEDGSVTASDGADEVSSVKSGGLPEGAGEAQTWGKPFQLEWLSTLRVPFYRTRGMRNPLNANRDIKIARDGTEVDPTVGQRLIGLFHQPLVVSGTSGRGTSFTAYTAVLMA
ncbi:yt521-b-like splicing factor [Grosmannia clavigera kw1407]|uniref:Yt521-b-like splicing factor n=1 Tax=Grosmannia clavigera (strain kw1407 / UAMH 11150) TaxID=655863 RepID=F0XUX5_GROCL|nr:yt521-b-like splicing factor [Grosmannia clavigera kw1407]EFW98847.1 yt521-b-like splicing factor [Grosmannia clavigera kw1407]